MLTCRLGKEANDRANDYCDGCAVQDVTALIVFGTCYVNLEVGANDRANDECDICVTCVCAVVALHHAPAALAHQQLSSQLGNREMIEQMTSVTRVCAVVALHHSPRTSCS
jgi:hypothetical protein